ncbi:MAG: hypothetical protein JWO67_6153 [Streptosporangiaceae bacterium]|nr:hypothetical protein [Streptosporangiaceae bacterium]
MADGFKIASAFVEVDPSTEGFKERLQAALDEAIAGVKASVPVGADTSDLDAKIAEARQKIADFKAEHADAKIGADAGDLDAKADEAKAKLDEFDGKEARAKLGLDKADFDAKMDDAEARLAAFRSESADARLGASGGSAGGGGGAGGGLLAGVTAGVAGLMPGIGGAATGLGLLGATGALAFGGIAKAVSAAHQAATNIGTSQQQLAATEFANSVQIQQAQQAVGSAHMQAAQDATQSAEQIASSQMSLAETERNASQSLIAAQQAVASSEHQLAESQFGEQQAQYNLTQARIQARITLQQLNNAEADAKLNVQASTLAVQQAQYQQALTDQNAHSTSLDRQQAALAVAQAEQQLTEAKQNQTNATQAANQVNKQGVNGQQSVIQAQHAVKDAIYGVTQAQQQAANASRALRVTELNNAAAIKQAQLAVAQAEQQAAYQQKRDAIAVQQAQQNLTNTYKQQRLQLAATRASSNQAAQQFARDMARLTPAGRDFVNQLLSMRGAWRGLEASAQNSVLPGMDTFLRGIRSLMPTITRGVREMGGAISHAFGQFGKQMQTPEFAHVLSGLMTEGVRFANIVLPAVAQFIGELAKIGSQQGASSGLANLLAGLMRGFTGLARVIGQNETAINSILTAIGRILTAAGPALGQMIGTFAHVLEPIASFLNSKAGQPFVKLLGDVVAGFLAWKLAQKAVIGPLEGLIGLPGKISEKWGKIFGDEGVASKVLGFAGKVRGGMLSAGRSVATFVADYSAKLVRAGIATGVWIAEHAAATAAFIAENVAQAASATAAFIAENAATLGIGAAIAGLVAGIIYLGTHWSQVWGDIKHWASVAWHFIYDGFGKYLLPLLGPAGLIALGVIELAQHWTTVWNTIKSVAEDVWTGIKIGARDFVGAFETIWHRLESVFKTPVNFLIGTVYDKGIARLWNDVVSHIGLGSIKLPIIPQMAAGGIVPGRDRGRDERLVAMRPEEGVLVPEAVRGIGGPGAVHALNNKFGRGGSETKSGVLPGFAHGGILGSIGGFLGNLGHDISGAIDVAKIIAAVVTGNTTAFTNAAGKLIGTNAAGDLGRMMIGIPKTLVSEAAQQLVGMFSTSGGQLPGGSSGAVGSLPANWRAIASFLAGHGFTKYAAAGVAGNIMAESGGNPEILQAGGGGGGGLIQWTPYPQGYITGDYLADLNTQLRAITTWGGGPGLVNRAKSPSNAAQVYQDFYERPASLTASLPLRMASANAVYKAMGWGKFDNGGWLMPTGMPGSVPVNHTGQPEAVLTPAESAAFVAIAKRLTDQGVGAGLGQQAVNFNYYGTQFPTAEQQAQQRRDMALMLGGG